VKTLGSSQANDRTPRVLLIAEAANPEWVSVPLVGWSLSNAIARICKTHLVTHVRNRDAIVQAGLVEGRDFTAIDSEAIAAPLYRLATLVRGGKGVGWTSVTALSTLSYYYFEHLAWRQFGDAIRKREYDIVHRITPLSPTTPSILARRCARSSVPFVLGPLNGGVPWPREFDAARWKEREWLSYVRSGYKLLPGYRNTLFESAAIIAGSRSTLENIPARLHDKCVYLPENAVDTTRFSHGAAPFTGGALRACFVGRLVPYKGPDMLIEAIAPLAREGRITLDVYGDGPLMPELHRLLEQHQIASRITLHGWIAHQELQTRMRLAQLFLFPSIREFGGGAVLEAMSLGIVPVVVDYAGPGELVTDEVGYKVPLGNRQQIIERLRSLIGGLLEQPAQLHAKSEAAIRLVQDLFTWEVKARQVAEVYQWVLGRRAAKPTFFHHPTAVHPGAPANRSFRIDHS
jgi:glycosyltransferase involved in cell wall biosynthesis